jgi:thiol-disulfide isomerase/thioredoxin
MSSFQDNINNTFGKINKGIINGGEAIIGKIQNNKMIVLLIIFFSVFSYYYYKTKIAPKLTPDYIPNNEFVENKTIKTQNEYATLYLFQANWCNLCEKLKPVWKDLKLSLNKTKINKHVLIFNEINDADEALIIDFETTYLNGSSIQEFPTIFLVKGNEVIEFEGTPTRVNLEEFVNTVL